ncbi:MAG: hypothetical protein EBZ48_16220, partial [Proteobacteria bacterium]|nr:hypothetical protein [Pseudomonadota bacterium]
MKKFLPIIVLLLLAVAAWYFSSQRQVATPTGTGQTQAASSSSAEPSPSVAQGGASQSSLAVGTSGTALDDTEGTMDMEVQPASRAYKSADEAMEAVKKGAADYNDTVLEQFTMPGEDCSWCPDFYKNLRDFLNGKSIPIEQMSYYGEILAISGRTENIQALIDGIKNPASQEQ